MTDCRNFFEQPDKRNVRTYENIGNFLLDKEIITQLVVHMIICISKRNCELIAIDLSKQQALHAVPKAIQQINFTENMDRAQNTAMFFILEEVKKVFWIFHKEL